jgi:hypothetical protein
MKPVFPVNLQHLKGANMNRFGKLILISIIVIGFVGCAFNQPIRYKTTDIQPSRVTQIKDVTLSVESFADKRREVSENGIVFVEGRGTHINGKRVCINSEEHYKKEPAAKQITVVVSEHLKQRGAFKDVLIDSKISADFQLQGAIRQFYGQQEFSYVVAAAGHQFGPIGVLATMNITTPGIIKIEFTDLKLVDKNGTLVKTLQDVSKSFEGEFSVDAHCWEIFSNTNLKLKEVVDILADEVEKNVNNSITKKPEEIKDISHNK